MKIKLFSIFLLIFSLLFLTACGEGEEASPSGDTPTGHNMIHCDAKEATCETRGHTAYEDCIDFACDYREGYEVIQPLGHDLIDVPEKAATLTEKGHTAYKKCSRCDYREGYSETDFSCSEHSFESFPEKIATDRENGHTAYKKCTVCGYLEGYSVTRAVAPCLTYLPSIEERISIFNFPENIKTNILGMYKAVSNFEESYKLVGEIETFDAMFCYNYLFNCVPEMMMVFNVFDTNSKNGKPDSIGFHYVMTKEEYTEKMEAVENQLIKLLDATKDMSDGEKAIYFADHLVQNCIYTKTAENRMNIYGGLVEGKVLCDGFSDSFNLLCNAAGIKCGTVVGTKGEAHSWNIVQLDGKYTYVDITECNSNDTTNVTHLHGFGLSTEKLSAAGYNREEEFKLYTPEAFSFEGSIKKVTTVFTASDDINDKVGKVIESAIKNGEKDLFIYSENRVIHNQVQSIFQNRLEKYFKDHKMNYTLNNLTNKDFCYLYFKLSYSG